jgi:hypothetical protein
MAPRLAYAGESIRLAQIADDEAAIEEASFTDCDVLGPAVVIMDDTTVSDSRWSGIPESVFWEMPEGREVMGALRLYRCRFERCTFRNIGIVAIAGDVAQMRAEFGV